MFGSSLLVKPATTFDDDNKYTSIYFPGESITWYDQFTLKPYQSNFPSEFPTTITTYHYTEENEVPIYRPPVYVYARGGSILFYKD